MQQFSNSDIADLRSRIDQIQEILASGAAGSQPDRIDGSRAGTDASEASLIEQVAFSIQMRRTRKSHFGSNQLSGPTWDMMLDLMLARSAGRELSASDLATGANVPLSSGMRMIAMLEQLGLAERFTDARDRRRSIVRLTDRGGERMASYFAKMEQAWQDRRRRAM